MSTFTVSYDSKGELKTLKNGVSIYVDGNFRTCGGIITLWQNKACFMYSFGSAKPDLLKYRSDWNPTESFKFIDETV